MDTFSALLAICAGNSPVPSEFPTQRPVTRSFDVFFDMCLNKCKIYVKCEMPITNSTRDTQGAAKKFNKILGDKIQAIW